MPAWSSGAFKVFRNRSNTEHRPTDLSKLRNNSIDIHVHTQRSYFVEPPRTRELCPNPKHDFYLGAPYEPIKIDKKQRPKPLSISYSLPCLPIVAVQDPVLLVGSEDHTDLALAENVHTQDNKGKQNAGSKRTRRHGMQSYPDSVREELRKVRTRSFPELAIVDGHLPDCSLEGGEISPSVYSDVSGYGEGLVVSSARVDSKVYEPPSWFSDEEEAKSDCLSGLEDLGPEYLQRILSIAAREGSTSPKAGPSAVDALVEPPTAKSWETFHIPSIPPSPVNSAPPPRRVPPRDPRLPPTDYFLYKAEYDDAAIAQYGSLPTEWVQYTRAYYKNWI
ncbi:hypothetical protein FRC06_004469 [Ceratobasidium sp. 370]|nr:hypothetical protein FRC06_004469 [Ceratobasidium sp. 370]